jgi:hypothetical protein
VNDEEVPKRDMVACQDELVEVDGGGGEFALDVDPGDKLEGPGVDGADAVHAAACVFIWMCVCVCVCMSGGRGEEKRGRGAHRCRRRRGVTTDRLVHCLLCIAICWW